MKTPIRTTSTALSLLAAILILGSPSEASAQGGFTSGYHSGWLGFFGGPTFGIDDEPILWRLAVRGGIGTRLGASPIALDAGVGLDGGYSSTTGPFDSKLTSRHVEIVPFGRALLLLSDSLSLYVGAGVGYVHLRAKASIDTFFGTTTNTADSTGMVIRVIGGIEYVFSDEVRIFVEPLGLNSYRFDGSSTELFSVLIGAGAIF